MKKPLKMLAFDFGASSGRAVLGSFDGTRLSTSEIHRFSNDPVCLGGHLYWDILRLFHEIKQGILKCANGGNRDVCAMAVDTWGVDFALLDEKGNLLSNPYHYRDVLTDDIMDEVFHVFPKNMLYSLTGQQFMKFNSIFQLFAMKYQKLPSFGQARTMLMMPDVFNYFLTGVKSTEYSIASTTQLLDASKKEWCEELISKLELPPYIFPTIVKPGTILGKISAEISQECGIEGIPVIAAASHDTASAVASVPAEGSGFAYISCGTWSLMGVETDNPVINEKSYSLSYANEGGVGNKIRFLKMIMGLWLVQECKRQWDREGRTFSFQELETMALEAPPFKSFINPDDNVFIYPGNMPERIAMYCLSSGQPVPENIGETVRCIAQSLALKYRMMVESLEEILDKKLPVIHMVGGGIKDRMLCQFTADATGRTVQAGPIEATATGNILVQAMALGEIGNLSELRQVVRMSFPIETYLPQDTEQWDEAYLQFRRKLN